jgi:hypothetical protein
MHINGEFFKGCFQLSNEQDTKAMQKLKTATSIAYQKMLHCGTDDIPSGCSIQFTQQPTEPFDKTILYLIWCSFSVNYFTLDME